MGVESHFAGKAPTVRSTYQRLIDVARTFGPLTEEAKKTSIHLVRHAAFAGVATRRSSLILTLKSATDIRNPRIAKREQTSANRWHVEVRLEKPAHIDRQLTAWLRPPMSSPDLVSDSGTTQRGGSQCRARHWASSSVCRLVLPTSS